LLGLRQIFCQLLILMILMPQAERKVDIRSSRFLHVSGLEFAGLWPEMPVAGKDALLAPAHVLGDQQRRSGGGGRRCPERPLHVATGIGDVRRDADS